MARALCLILLVGALGAGGGPSPAYAQEDDGTPAARALTPRVNLFETLDPSSPIDGVRLELPDDWAVQDARLLRYGTTSVPIRLQAGERDGAVFLTTDAQIQSPHELVVHVQAGRRLSSQRWHLTPFVTSGPAPAQDTVTRRMRPADRRTHVVERAPPPRPEGPNQALDLTGATEPPILQVPADRAPHRGRSFTVEFWLRTTGLDQVILSSWTGDETTPYPLEFVIDSGGRLRFYCGQAGRHQSLRSTGPVADGQWHHAAVVYDASESRLHLMLDGVGVDSAQAEALPRHSGALPLALGGRRQPKPERGGTASAQRFAGQLDELRIWPSARAPSTIRRQRKRPYAVSGPPDTGPLRLSFNAPPPTNLDWGTGARRVPSHLSFQPPLRGLQAHTDGTSVTLRWEAQVAPESPVDAGQFVIERSLDGTSFTPVDHVRPSETETASGQAQEFTYTDENVPGKIIFYRVRYASSTSDAERSTGTIKIGLGSEPAPERAVNLVGNFPNPFKTSTTIAYQVEEAQPVTLTIWNLSGKRIATLANGVHEPGYHEQTLTADGLPSGTYFARLETPEGIQSARMVLLK